MIHKSNVNFQNLIRDLSEMYPNDVAEVIIIELIANSLDAGADFISVEYDSKEKILVVKDNGNGMSASVFEEYHDFAAGLKVRGDGIGFAGLGAKISFNIADKVITQTRSKSFSGGSNWHLHTKKELVWENIKPVHLSGYGTRVDVHFRSDTKTPYTTSDDLKNLLYRSYLPLLDPKFLKLYSSIGSYSEKLKFEINGKIVPPIRIENQFHLSKTKDFFLIKTGKKYGYGIFGVAETEYPLGGDVCGILLCTLGKVIKPDFFNQFPSSLGPRIFGVVEIPGFAKYLTTAKNDFIRKGRHREFEGMYDPIRQEFKKWLKDIGVESGEVINTDEASKLEKELNALMKELPELGDFFGFRTPKSILIPKIDGPINAVTIEGIETTLPITNVPVVCGVVVGPVGPGNVPGLALVEKPEAGVDKAKPISRISKRGPKITFQEVPERIDLAWVEGNNIIVNNGHPGYRKISSSSALRRLHCLFAIACAIQRFLINQGETLDPMFVDRMMAAWGKK